MSPRDAARLLAEALGTAALLAVVVGSGIMAERLAGGNAAVALLANTAATACALGVLITAFGPISGAHFNPVVSLWAALTGRLPWRVLPAYVAVQVGAAFAGVVAAHAMFGLPVLFASTHVRATPGEWLGEIVATFGLVLTIVLGERHRPHAIPWLVASWIAAAYWFTSSTSFANPAVTLARAASDTFAGIRPADAPAFIAAQLAGMLLALAAARVLLCEHARHDDAHPD